MITPQKLAFGLLRKYWDGTLPVNTITLANKLGFTVFETNEELNNKLSEVDLFSKSIFINNNLKISTQRFCVGHGIGSLFTNTFNEAIDFSRALIVPKLALFTMVKIKWYLFDDLCSVFNVPEKIMVKRLIECEYIYE